MIFLLESTLNLPLFVTTPIRAFLSEGFARDCRAIYLTGSWALKTADSSSDIDLLAMIDDGKPTVETRAMMKGWLRRTHASSPPNHNFRFDLKCLTMPEMSNAYRSDQHFAVWTRLSSGILLMGCDIRNGFPLRNELLRMALEKRLDEIDEVFLLACKKAYFEYASALTINCLKTFYFVMTFALRHRIKEPLRKWIATMLGTISKPIYNAYDRLAHRGLETLEPVIRFETCGRCSVKYPAESYKALANKSNEIMRLGNDIYHQVLNELSISET